MTLESSLHMSFNVILIFPMWVSLFVSSPKMSKRGGKMEFFCWLALTLYFLSHCCVHSTKMHWNVANTKSAPCSQACLCPMQYFTSPWHCINIPIFSLSAPGREGRSVHTSQVKEGGSTYRKQAAINWCQSWVESTGFSGWVSDPALLWGCGLGQEGAEITKKQERFCL